MEANAIYVCRLCLKTCRYFEKIEKTHYETLHVISLTLSLAISHEPVICVICAVKLQKCLAFKTTSLNVKDSLQDVIGLCLFCKENNIGPTISLNSGHIDILLLKAMMEQYFPELDLHINANLVTICPSCYENLQQNFDFIINCLSVEQQISKCCLALGTNGKGQIELRIVGNLTANSTVKAEEYFDGSWAVKAEDCYIEAADIKDDYNNQVVSISVKEENISDKEDVNIANDKIKPENVDEYEIKESHEEIDTKVINHIKIEETWIEENVVQVKDKKANETVDAIKESIESVVQKFTCHEEDPVLDSSEEDIGPFEMKGTKNLPLDANGSSSKNIGIKRKKNHETNPHRNSWWHFGIRDREPNPIYYSKWELRAMIKRIYISGEKKYQCQVCNFVAKAKCSLNRHMMRHQNPSELNFYYCNNCNYKSNWKSCLVSHMQCHRDPSQNPLQQCPYCPFTARLKSSIRLHLIKHKTCPNVIMFECYICGFKTCHKKAIKYHTSTHNKQNRPKVYRCIKCMYQTRIKAKLKTHLKSPLHLSRLPIQKCDICEYESKYSFAMIMHKESHREAMNCEHCQFKSKFSSVLLRHLRKVHKVNSKQIRK